MDLLFEVLQNLLFLLLVNLQPLLVDKLIHQVFLQLVYIFLHLKYLEFIALQYYKYSQFLLNFVCSIDYYIKIVKVCYFLIHFLKIYLINGIVFNHRVYLDLQIFLIFLVHFVILEYVESLLADGIYDMMFRFQVFDTMLNLLFLHLLNLHLWLFGKKLLLQVLFLKLLNVVYIMNDKYHGGLQLQEASMHLAKVPIFLLDLPFQQGLYQIYLTRNYR